MRIDWINFTPWTALAGGLLIGLASALFLLGNGRVARIAGILASPLQALWTGGSLRQTATACSSWPGCWPRLGSGKR